MSRVFRVDPADPTTFGPAVAAAAEALRDGGLVVLPTETVYGIAARPDDPAVTGRLFEAKRRPAPMNLPVLAVDAAAAWAVGRPVGPAQGLAAAFWPGPLTLVLPRTERSRPWALGDHETTVAVRVSDHPLSCALVEAAGPVAATSANISGRPPAEDEAALLSTFEDQVAVYVVLASGVRRPGGTPSTVFDLTVEPPILLRSGPIDPADLARAMAAPPGSTP